MLRQLLRVLPPAERRDLTTLTAWLSAGAALHGVVLGLTGLLVAALLDPGRAALVPAVALSVALLAFLVVQWIAQMTAFRVGSQSARALHVQLGDQLGHLPLGWFTPTRQAEAVTTATSGVTGLMSYPALLLRPALTAVVTPVAAALTLIVLDWRYTLAVLIAGVISWLVSGYSSRLAVQVDARRHEASTEATSRLQEYATRQHLIRTDGSSGDSRDLRLALKEVHDRSRRSAGTVIPGLLLFSVTLNALLAALIGLGVAWMSGGSMIVTTFVGVVVVLVRVSTIAATGAELVSGLRMQQGALNRLSQIMTTAPLPVREAAPTDHRGLVAVDRVSFSYDDTRVLDGISFELPTVGLTALVGPSGAGKTTLIRMLARFWDPTAGSVTLNGTDLRSMSPEELYAQIATVLQDDYLLDTSIGENIRAGRPEASPQEVAEAVSAAGLTQMIDELPEGLDTSAGPGGSRLSGGQRQRICIARALLKIAPLTLMDEATSALDPENRRLVTEAAFRLARTGSVVLVAHDLDSVARADQILVVDDCRVVQSGVHEVLSSQEGLYQRLLRDHLTTGVAGP
ncbi:ABC transporter ATP-binding protein [Kineosporia sp. NBRC 101731]|uniref:ABC transporter ATP-binding protein n=1 Tax=Kineosporia sp. NBRC 101731 TaxID=3032199 RepID=UPI0024A129AE|nr:ABC transporter ATP-binding protein [Kineosporia sp. NBRC 101731]GLY32357.1 ABC transporter ATP-binding protein [Kineosporia sp. NBRC 101731]